MERIILPDSTILIDYLLSKATWLISGLRVNTARMIRNANSTLGLIFSGQLLLDLAAAGMLREEAYRLVQSHAMHAWETESDFRAAVAADQRITTFLNGEQLEKTFSLERHLKNVNTIFGRVFGSRK